MRFGAGQHGQLGVGHRGAPVVVRVHGQADVLAMRHVAAHPLDLVRVHVGGGPLDGARQVDDDLAPRTGLPDIHHRAAHLGRKVQLGVHEDLRRVLIAEVAVAQVLRGVLDHGPGALDSQLFGLRPVVAEHHPAEHRRSRVVQVHRGPGRPGQRLHGSLDELVPGLGQHRNLHVVGDPAALDEAADEVEVSLAGRRETDLDLLVAHPDQQVEHGPLAGRAHRVDERLVAVPEVGGQPPGGRRDALAGPGPVGQVHRAERGVPLAGHTTRLLPDTAVRFLARHLIMGYVRLDRVLLGLHGKISSCADRAAASDHANTPRRGSRP